MGNAAQIYAVALAVSFLAAYTLGIKKRSGRLSVRGYLEFPGLFRHFCEGIQQRGWRSVLSPDLLSAFLFIAILAWLFLVALFWELVTTFGGSPPFPAGSG